MTRGKLLTLSTQMTRGKLLTLSTQMTREKLLTLSTQMTRGKLQYTDDKLEIAQTSGNLKHLCFD